MERKSYEPADVELNSARVKWWRRSAYSTLLTVTSTSCCRRLSHTALKCRCRLLTTRAGKTNFPSERALSVSDGGRRSLPSSLTLREAETLTRRLSGRRASPPRGARSQGLAATVGPSRGEGRCRGAAFSGNHMLGGQSEVPTRGIDGPSRDVREAPSSRGCGVMTLDLEVQAHASPEGRSRAPGIYPATRSSEASSAGGCHGRHRH
jgi:hypothetical protein